jgi:outer membrane murein-binding lipoprotein Lpp
MNTELWEELSAANRKANKLATANKQLEARVAELEVMVQKMAQMLGIEAQSTEATFNKAA